jgi:hypothetical protein
MVLNLGWQLARVIDGNALPQLQLGDQAGWQKLKVAAGWRSLILPHRVGVISCKQGSCRESESHVAHLMSWFEWSCQLRRRDYGGPKIPLLLALTAREAEEISLLEKTFSSRPGNTLKSDRTQSFLKFAGGVGELNCQVPSPTQPRILSAFALVRVAHLLFGIRLQLVRTLRLESRCGGKMVRPAPDLARIRPAC